MPSRTGARRVPNIQALSIALTGQEPPSEFRIFRAGENETTKGTFLFDDEAAQSVLSEYREHGIDLMIDYDHASLNEMAIDPALAARAAGWFALDLRNGELWAVNVRWTPPAAAALRQSEWRFMSPAFSLKDGRITSLLNVALTNIPATRRLDPLMAANAKGNFIMASDSGLSPKLVNSALEAVASKDAKSALDILKQMLSALLGGVPDDTSGGGDTSTPPDAPMDPEAASAALSAAIARGSAFVAAARQALKLTGLDDIGSAMTELARRSTLALKLEEEQVKLASDRALLEAGERRTLVGSLVKMGAEIPATAWSDDAGSVPVERLSKEPIESLRDRVAKLGAKGVHQTNIKPPVSLGGGAPASNNPLGLTDRELTLCASKKITPEQYLSSKNRLTGKS